MQLSIEKYRSLISTLEHDAERWNNELSATENVSLLLLVNSIMSATFVTYCGPFSTVNRELAKQSIFKIVQTNVLFDQDIPQDLPLVFRNATVGSFLMTDHDRQYAESPAHFLQFSTDNIALITGEHRTTWPVILDPYQTSVSYIRHAEAPNNLIVASYDDKTAGSVLKNALLNNCPLLFVDVDPKKLWSNLAFRETLSRKTFQSIRQVLSVKVAGEEVPYPKDFRMYFVGSSVVAITQSLEQHSTLIHAMPTKEDIEVRVRGMMISLNNTESFNHQAQLVALIPGKREQSSKQEAEIIEAFDRVASSVPIESTGTASEMEMIDRVLDAHSSYDETVRNLQPFVEDSSRLAADFAAFGGNIPKFVASVYDVLLELAPLRKSYYLLGAALLVFESMIADFHKKGQEFSVLELFFAPFLKRFLNWIHPSLSSFDRIAFGFSVAVTVGIEKGVIPPEFLTFLNATLWSRIGFKEKKTNAPATGVSKTGSKETKDRAASSKAKSSSVTNDMDVPDVGLLFTGSAQAHPWLRVFDDVMDDLLKFKTDIILWRDGKITDDPLPQLFYDNLSPVQAFMLRLMFKPNRLIPVCKRLTSVMMSEVGISFFFDQSLDLNPVDGTSPTTPVVLVCETEMLHCCLVASLSTWANLQGVALTSYVPKKKADLADISAFIKTNVESASWVLVPRTIAFKIRQQLCSAVAKTGLTAHHQFRLLICVDNDETIPASMVTETHIRSQHQSNKVFKQNFVRIMNTIPAELLERNKHRSDWLPLLHNASFVDRSDHCLSIILIFQLSASPDGKQFAMHSLELL